MTDRAREVIAEALDGFVHREIAIEAATGRILAALEAEGLAVVDELGALDMVIHHLRLIASVGGEEQASYLANELSSIRDRIKILAAAKERSDDNG